MAKIKYTKSRVSTRPKFTTSKYGNLLSDTWQGEVMQFSDGTWAGYLFNWSSGRQDECKSFANKTAATRWVNQKLRLVGVK